MDTSKPNRGPKGEYGIGALRRGMPGLPHRDRPISTVYPGVVSEIGKEVKNMKDLHMLDKYRLVDQEKNFRYTRR